MFKTSLCVKDVNIAEGDFRLHQENVTKMVV